MTRVLLVSCDPISARCSDATSCHPPPCLLLSILHAHRLHACVRAFALAVPSAAVPSSLSLFFLHLLVTSSQWTSLTT